MRRAKLTTFATLYTHIKELPENLTFLNHIDSNEWKTYSKTDFINIVHYLTLAFEAEGWRGKQIALVIAPSAHWIMIDYALMLSGAVSVPLFTNISTRNLRFQINDSDIHTAFVESKKQTELLKEIDNSLTCIDIHNSRAYRKFIEKGKTIEKASPLKFQEILGKVIPNDTISIVYTSGTSGLPKGVELSHFNLISQILDTGAKYKFDANRDKALSFLPLAHIFERMVMHFYLSTGMSIYYADDVQNVGKLLREVKPTIMTVVPRLLEKVYFKMYNKAMEGNFIKQAIVKLAFYRANHKDPTTSQTWLENKLDKLVYSKLRTSLGGNLRMMISGGAALSSELYRFFWNIGIPPYQGYGLTEASPVICANAPNENKVGTCGKHFIHTEVKLSEEKELLARGPGIMKGYHNNPKATKESIDEQGWLHTGDLASIDNEGYITITGRKKELAKTSTGEYISLEYMEQELKKSGWFEHLLIIGDKRPFVVALLALDETQLQAYTAKNKFKNREEALESKALKKRIQGFITKLNKQLNHWERIRYFHLIKRALTIENGELTPSMKLSRVNVEKHFKNEIMQMYVGHILEGKG